ncbi:hypothetical protein AAG906_034297 [Vitis piasezkii]
MIEIGSKSFREIFHVEGMAKEMMLMENPDYPTRTSHCHFALQLQKLNRRKSLSPPLSPRKNYVDSREKHGPSVARSEQDGIFVGDGVEYDIPSKDMSQSPISEDMEESPRNKERISYLGEPAYGPNMQTYDVQVGLGIPQDPRFMTQEENDRGFGSVFKWDDQSDDEDDLVVYIGGTLKQKRNEQHITSRRKQCQKLHSSLG